MDILIIGGTRFLGRTIVELGLEYGHRVTIFNRGKTNPDLFPSVERITGERDADIGLIRGRKWDVAVDTCGYVPRIVKKSAEILADAVEHYTFISSINAYADFTKPGIDEDSGLAAMADNTMEEITNDTYGPLKVMCEQAAETAMPGRVMSLRCGLIVGPYDPSDRFTYWPVRISRGGDVLVPSPPSAQIQFIDVRDLADFILKMAAHRKIGIFNATGPEYELSMQGFLNECIKATRTAANLTWVSEEFLIKREIYPPVWVPKEWAGINQVNCQKAIAAGLRFRPLDRTILDTLAWHKTRPNDYSLRAGLAGDLEKKLLLEWSGR